MAASRMRARAVRSPLDAEHMFNTLNDCSVWGKRVLVPTRKLWSRRLRAQAVSTKRSPMTQVAVAQFAPGQDKDENRRSVVALTARAAAEGAQVVLLPESSEERRVGRAGERGRERAGCPRPGCAG